MRAIADSLSLSFHIRSEKFRFSETGFWHQLGRATFREARFAGPILSRVGDYLRFARDSGVGRRGSVI